MVSWAVESRNPDSESTQSCKKRLERLAVGGWSLDIHGKQANHNQHCYGPGAGITAFKKQPTSQDIPWGYLMVSAVYLWPTEIHNRDEIQYTVDWQVIRQIILNKIKNDLDQLELPVKWGNEEVLMSTMSKMDPVWLFTHSLPIFQVIGAKLYWSPLSIPPCHFSANVGTTPALLEPLQTKLFGPNGPGNHTMKHLSSVGWYSKTKINQPHDLYLRISKVCFLWETWSIGVHVRAVCWWERRLDTAGLPW